MTIKNIKQLVMTYQERKEKEKHLLYLVQQGQLICLEKVANDYGCCVRTIERLLKGLREEGYNILFCRKSNKYYVKN